MAGALEEGNGTKARQTRRFRGPCAFFAALNLRDPGGSSCSAMRVKNEDEALAMEREVSAP